MKYSKYKTRRPISEEMRPCPQCGSKEKAKLPNPYEIQKSDIGRLIDWSGFGTVKEFDVGKRLKLIKGILYMENEEQVAKRKGKGWREKPDASGKAPRHVQAANKCKVADVVRTPIVKEETDWKKTAKKELERELGVNTKIRSYEYYEDLGALALESVTGAANNGESEWIVFKNPDEAELAAIAKVKEDLENEPGLFTQSWLQEFIKISGTDRRLIANEEADDYVDNVLGEDDLIKEADLEEEMREITERQSELDDEDPGYDQKYASLEKEREQRLETAKDKVREDRQKEIYEALKDPIQYFVEDQGIYSREDLLKQNFITIDVDEAAKDAVDTDGVAHFLDNYDNSEVELASGAVAFGTN